MDSSDWSKFALTGAVLASLVGMAVLAGHVPAIHDLYMQVSGSLLGLLGVHHGHDLVQQRLSGGGDEQQEQQPSPVLSQGPRQEPEGALQGPQVGEEVPAPLAGA
jgi:hypothetical protein